MNKIETRYEAVLHLNVKLGEVQNFTFTRNPSYIALFANVIKFFCSYARKNYATVEIHRIKGLKQLLPSLNVIRTQGAVPTNGRFTWTWGTPEKVR